MSKETRLLQASLAGDRNAFEQIVEKYQSTICAITFSGTARLDVSEELAQETFLNAWENLHQLRDLKGFRSWLYSIARNTLRNYRRRKEPASLEAHGTDIATEETQNPPEILMRQEEQMMLEQAIMRLPAKYREPLVLFCRQQQSVRQAAEVLGLSEATVRTRLHRARNLLREQVAERLEHVLKETGPRKEFTKAVMVAIGSVPLGLAVTTEAAASATAGHAAVTSGISTVLGSVGMKVAAVAAVVAVGALVYTHRGQDRGPASSPADAAETGAASLTAPLRDVADAEPAGASALPPASDPVASHRQSSQEASHPDPETEGTQEATAKPEPSVSETIVTGTVLDKNTLRPISAAKVGFEPAETVLTDAEGRFRLSWNQSREEVWICAMASGYASHRIALRVTRGDSQDVGLRLQPGLTLAGVVMDPNQEPIGNVTVRVMSNIFAYPPVTTNDRGEFEIDGLNPEDAAVHVTAEHVDYVCESSAVMQSGRLGEATRTILVLAPRPSDAVLSGQATEARSESTAQVTAQQASSQIETTRSNENRIYGRVVDAATGHPLDCFRIIRGNVTGAAALMTLFGYTFTSATGDFDTGRWHLVPGEPAPLTACAEGYDPLTLEAIPVQTVPEDPDRTVFRLQRNERRSTIYVGHVVDNEGRAIQGAEVGFRVEGHMPERGFSRVVTDAIGTYMISSVDPHEQIVFVRAQGHAPRYFRMSDLLLEAPGVFTDVVLDRPATVSGYAWDELGRPIADTRIVSGPVARSEDDLLFTVPFWQVLWPETRTDEQGHYRLTGLPVGKVHVGVMFEDQRHMAPQEVTVHPGESVELNFGDRGGFVISGVVTNGADVLAQVDVQLRATEEGVRSHSGRTDAAGRFKLIGVPAGEYVFATLIPQEADDQKTQDPNDTSHILYEVMDIQNDVDLTVDYQARSIHENP